MIDAIRRRHFDESLNDIKNFNSMVFNLELKNAGLQPNANLMFITLVYTNRRSGTRP